MVKVNELRIGDWMNGTSDYVKYPMPLKIIGIGTFTYEFWGKNEKESGVWSEFSDGTIYTSNELFPIPLTPEILEKAGFEKEERGSDKEFDGVELWYHKEGVDIYNSTSGFIYATYTRYSGYGFKAGCSLKYVHKLQNLYFALTGVELNIEL